MYNIKTTKATKTRFDSINWDSLGFGQFFSDHMYISQYKDGKWNDGEIVPYGPLPMEPSICAIHYGQSIFEGLKAYRRQDGHINLFRPSNNARRLNHSGKLVCIPPFNEELFVEALKQLVKLDNKFVPSKPGTSLYIRPVVFGDGEFLGVHASKTYKHIIMTSPVGSYYPNGMAPVKILVDKDHVRAVRGGLGSAKTAANYAASLLGSETAKKNGHNQVLWLDAINRHFVDEVGAMNIMFIINNELVTPSLESGTILAGITRDTVLTLAKDFGIPISEKPITVEEVIEAHNRGHLQEVFGTGTAAVISPVGQLSYDGKEIIINENKIGNFAQKFYDTITGIQYGKLEDKYGWTIKVEID